jgi:heptosyltransferase-2
VADPRLLIRLGSLGDVVLATGAANAAREAWGDRCVDVLVKSEWAPVWENHPAVRAVLSLEPDARGAAGLRRWARRLRAAGYVETVDLQASVRTRILCRWSGLDAVRRPRGFARRRRALVAAKRWGPPEAFQVGRAFVDAVAPGSRALPSLHPGSAHRDRARRLVPGDGARIGLVPGARHATKRWPLERFVAVGRGAAGGGSPVPVFFGPDEGALLAAWRAAWPETSEWVAVREDLLTTAACLERVTAVVTNDTGLMHVAAAMGTPVVVLFGPTVPGFGFRPLGEGHRIVEMEALACRPCSLHGGPRCPRGHFRCMLDIDAARIRAVLREGAASPRPARTS